MINIKRMELSDLDFFCEVRNSCAEIFLHNPKKFTIEETKNWYITSNPDFYVIYYNSEKIGYFRTSNYDPIDNSMYIGCDLSANFRGKGLGFLAYKTFIPEMFAKYNLQKIVLEVLSQNNIAKNLYSKLGFKNIPERNYNFNRNGQITTSEFWRLDKNEYFGIITN